MSEGATYLFRNVAEHDRLIDGFIRFLKYFVSTGGATLITIERYEHPKTRMQENMWRGLCREIAEYHNAQPGAEKTSTEAVARDLKIKYGIILTEYSPVSGTRGARFKSTAKYEAKEMSDLITATLAWAADHRIPLEDPRA